MNRAYRRSKLKAQRRKLKEDKMLREICSNVYRVFTNAKCDMWLVDINKFQY